MLFSIFRQIAAASVLGMNRRNLELVMPRNERRHFPIANDKLLTKTVLEAAGIPVSPTLATFRSFMDVRSLAHTLRDFDQFVVKPARGSGGNGILVIAGRDADAFRTAGGRRISASTLERHVGDIVFGVFAHDHDDIAIVEPRLTPHPFFADLYPEGLSDIRFILADDTFALAMLRIPTRASEGRANLHQGAIGIGIDGDTGRTVRAWQHHREIARHSETGEMLIGRTVPHFDTLLRIARATSRALPLKFLGVDIVVDAHLGPLVLEVNVRPGIEIQNVTGVSLRDRLSAQGILR